MLTLINNSNAQHRASNPKKKRLYTALFTILLGTSLLSLGGCQTLHSSDSNANTTDLPIDTTTPSRLQTFNIDGKIGVVVPQNQSTTGQSGSAFYVWAQEDDRFAIDFTGALGIGHTVIEYNGSTATLVSERTGKLTATDPEALLFKASGWRAPISQLPYWISGRPAPSDTNNQHDAQGRLQTAHNSGWVATFSYANASAVLPSRIKVQQQDGYRVILTIRHNIVKEV